MTQPFTIFTLASARSGTSFIADFFQRNVLDCYSTHEPYLTPGNPVLFGKPIEWNTCHEDMKLLPVLQKKCRFIKQCKQPVYFEANHAFLKAFNRHAPQMLENAGFIHLIRNPKQVAKSEWLREQVIRRFHIPFIDYVSDKGQLLFRWSLTGEEPLYQQFAENSGGYPLSRFGFYILQWFEIEYRAQQLQQHHGWKESTFVLDVKTDLHKENTLHDMLDFFGLNHKLRFDMNLHRNKTWFAGSSDLTESEHQEFRQIIRHLPEDYLHMLGQSPYSDSSFASVFVE